MCAHLCYCASAKYYCLSCSFQLGKENRNKPIYGFFLYHILHRFFKRMADFKMLLIKIILRNNNSKMKNDLCQYCMLMKMKTKISICPASNIHLTWKMNLQKIHLYNVKLSVFCIFKTDLSNT